MADMLINYNQDEYFRDRDRRLGSQRPLSYDQQRAMTDMRIGTRDTNRLAAAQQTLGLDPSGRAARMTEMRIASDERQAAREAQTRQTTTPPAPVSFGSGVGVIPTPRGWMPIAGPQPESAAPKPIITPQGVVLDAQDPTKVLYEPKPKQDSAPFDDFQGPNVYDELSGMIGTYNPGKGFYEWKERQKMQVALGQEQLAPIPDDMPRYKRPGSQELPASAAASSGQQVKRVKVRMPDGTTGTVPESQLGMLPPGAQVL